MPIFVGHLLRYGARDHACVRLKIFKTLARFSTAERRWNFSDYSLKG
jgi:hypothetical protein